MDSTYELEDRFIKLDRELQEILRSASKQHTRESIEEEVKSLRKLARKIGSHRLEVKDTTLLIKEMREKSYDI